jgi:hypothetical protein
LEDGKFPFLSARLEFSRTSVHPGLSFGDEAVEETSPVARHGFDGFDPSPFGSQVAKASAQVTLTPHQRLRRHAEGIPHPIRAVFAGVAEDAAPTDIPFGS